MTGEPKTLTPEQGKAAREAFETRYKGFTWWTEKYGELHPALHKDKDGNYLEGSQRKYWTGFQEGYAAALGVRVEARDVPPSLLPFVGHPTTYECYCEKCGWTGSAEAPDYVHPGCGYPAVRSAAVVARDEAAELRAAVREFFKAEDAVAALHEPNGTYTDFHAAADIANAARETLRRLAGGEQE